MLDAGCGEGWLSRLLTESGAIVTAVDFSTRMLEIAKERTPEDLQIDYQHANLEKLDQFPDNSLDIIVSILVLMDLPEYQSAIQELFRVLKPGGKSIFVISHPCFTSDGEWIRDDQGIKLHWKVDNYFKERAYKVDFYQDSETDIISFHRTITTYFKTIKDAGFEIEDLIEPYPSPESIQEYPRFIDDLRMCHFLIFVLSKD